MKVNRLIPVLLISALIISLGIMASTTATSIETYFEITEKTPGEYEFEIFNRKGEVVYSDTAYRAEPRIEVIDDQLIWIGINAGTATMPTRFYDLDNDRLSDWFDTPRAAKNGLVALMKMNEQGTWIIAVQSILDDQFYWKFERDFSPVANAGGLFIDAKFVDDEQLYVKYLAGNDFEQIEEILFLD